jgi:hypothetical protein
MGNAAWCVDVSIASDRWMVGSLVAERWSVGVVALWVRADRSMVDTRADWHGCPGESTVRRFVGFSLIAECRWRVVVSGVSWALDGRHARGFGGAAWCAVVSVAS